MTKAEKKTGIWVNVGCRRRGSCREFTSLRAGSVMMLIPEEEADAFIAERERTNPSYEFRVKFRAICVVRGK